MSRLGRDRAALPSNLGADASRGFCAQSYPQPWIRQNRPWSVRRPPWGRAGERPWSIGRRARPGAPFAQNRLNGATGAPLAAPSGRELGAALAAASGQDRAACARAHTQPEAVGLGTTPVVRLEGPLAHELLQERWSIAVVTSTGEERLAQAVPRCGGHAKGANNGLLTLRAGAAVGQAGGAVISAHPGRHPQAVHRSSTVHREFIHNDHGEATTGVLVGARCTGPARGSRYPQAVDNYVDHGGA